MIIFSVVRFGPVIDFCAKPIKKNIAAQVRG